jgi:hypothetical protein
MALNVVLTQNLGAEFDLGVLEAGKIHVKLGSGLTRDPATGEIAFDAGVLPFDVNVAGLSWNPATNELTLSESDGTTHVVSLATLAADKFLAGSSYDPATHELTLTMTDGSSYVIALADLAPVAATGGIQGDGTSGNPLRPDFDQLPITDSTNVNGTDMFVMVTDPYPDGSRVGIAEAADLLHTELMTSSYPYALSTLLTVDVQDAFGNHLFYALP